MTHALARAIELVQQLPEEKQDRIGALLMWELEEDERWSRTTREHWADVGKLIERVLGE